MTLLTTGRLLLHCGAHTAEPKIGDMSPIPPNPYYQNLLFSVARGWKPGRGESGRSERGRRGAKAEGGLHGSERASEGGGGERAAAASALPRAHHASNA